MSVKEWMTEQLAIRDWSLRYFSERASIDVATLSKVMNGKRALTLQHAEKIAEAFDCPMNDLLHAAGYPIAKTSPYVQQITDEISEVTNMTETEWHDHLQTLVLTYEEESVTPSGEQQIGARFPQKMKNLQQKGTWLTTIQSFFEQFQQKERPTVELMILGGALLYFIAPVDLIPDYLFAIGYLDDALAIQLASQKLKLGS